LPRSGRFAGHGGRVDVYVDFFGLAAAAEKLAAEEKERTGNDDDKDYNYRHDCGVAAATAIFIRHKIDPPLCTEGSFFSGGVSVF
jgi:hypothetical protein